MTTKIVALVDALGKLVRFLLLPGQAHDMKGVAPLIDNVSFGALLADKAFDARHCTPVRRMPWIPEAQVKHLRCRSLEPRQIRRHRA
ncbi:MAG TPA: transposase [Rhodovulum sp.]|nr:transposase [Rhodovulum sp.]